MVLLLSGRSWFILKSKLYVTLQTRRPFVMRYRLISFVSADIAATQVMLKIEDLGLATTWIEHFDNRKMKKLFPSMAEYDIQKISYPTLIVCGERDSANKKASLKLVLRSCTCTAFCATRISKQGDRLIADKTRTHNRYPKAGYVPGKPVWDESAF